MHVAYSFYLLSRRNTAGTVDCRSHAGNFGNSKRDCFFSNKRSISYCVGSCCTIHYSLAVSSDQWKQMAEQYCILELNKAFKTGIYGRATNPSIFGENQISGRNIACTTVCRQSQLYCSGDYTKQYIQHIAQC